MTNPTTAEALGQFANELKEAGIDFDTAQALIRTAGRDMIRDEGFTIRPAEQHCCVCAAQRKATR